MILDAIARLSTALMDAHADEAARTIEGMSPEEASRLLSTVPHKSAAKTLGAMIPSSAARAMSHLERETIACLLEDLPPAAAALILRRSGEREQDILMEGLAQSDAKWLKTVMAYPEGTAGALADPLALAVPFDLSVGDTLKQILKSKDHARYYVYVVDREDFLIGVTTMRSLIFSDNKLPITEVMSRDVVALKANTSHEGILANPYWNKFHALPVVDERGVFQGALTYETLRYIESKYQQRTRRKDTPFETLMALGELYWFGLVGAMGTLTEDQTKTKKRDPREKDR